MTTDLDALLHDLAKERNQGKEPDELHLAYERELWRLRTSERMLTQVRTGITELHQNRNGYCCVCGGAFPCRTLQIAVELT